MSALSERFDVAVIGSGPAGRQAALQAGQAGKKVLVVEQDVSLGGACVHRGTIPSKTLRETALALTNFQRRSGNVFEIKVTEDLQVASLMTRRECVSRAHADFMAEELERNAVEVWHGRARFRSPELLEVLGVDRSLRQVRAEFFVIATGSRPRTPEHIPVDHEHVLDSDSILSMIYLPSSLTVLDGGVIASEYASIFTALGVQVIMIDPHPAPLGFLDEEISGRFRRAYENAGGRYLGGHELKSVAWDGLSSVITEVEGGEQVLTDKLLCCLGREAMLDGLGVDAAGLERNSRGHLPVNEHYQTKRPEIYAVGDVIGPPALASTSMDQGRRAICHALGLKVLAAPETIPMGIYTIPEISSVGLSEKAARQKHGEVLIGRAGFDQVARGQITDVTDGLLKLVADPTGRRLLGVQIVGEGASDLIHLGQMVLIQENEIDFFVENTFNFPTLTEAYRVAALDLIWQRARQPVSV